MKTWYTSDLHFCHRNIVQYTKRSEVVTQEDHDEWLIDLWNSQVKPGDTVWHMGDFAFNKRKVEQFTAITDRLNGNKKFIRGNHDDKDVLKKSGFEWYDLKGGSITIGEKIREHVVMCHYPMAIWDKQHHGSFMLHGHSHGSYNPANGKILDVGLDSAYNILGEHRFFTDEDILNYMATRDVQILDHHNDRTKQ